MYSLVSCFLRARQWLGAGRFWSGTRRQLLLSALSAILGKTRTWVLKPPPHAPHFLGLCSTAPVPQLPLPCVVGKTHVREGRKEGRRPGPPRSQVGAGCRVGSGLPSFVSASLASWPACHLSWAQRILNPVLDSQLLSQQASTGATLYSLGHPVTHHSLSHSLVPQAPATCLAVGIQASTFDGEQACE